MDQSLAIAQALKYAEELRELHRTERLQRQRVEQSLTWLEDSYRMTVGALAVALELRDDLTGDHAERVTRLAMRLAERVAPDLAPDPQLEYGFLLHDLGKIGVPDAILLKPGPLDAAERSQIELHPQHGARILDQIPYLRGVTREIVVSHHERWDGTGYPHGLVGTGIPLGARIFAVADTFDAMTNDRPYRAALPVAAAIDEITRESGRQFDPTVVSQFAVVAVEQAA